MIRSTHAAVRRAVSSIGWLVALAVAGAFLNAPSAAQQVRDASNPEGRWERLEGCLLVTNATVDGDSFHVRHGEREYIFRLYFVDAPERDASIRDRILDQAAYFGVAPSKIPQAGEQAARFTREFLTGTNFVIHTRWQNAMGRSSLARFYGVVEEGGTNLAAALVSQGLARIYGLRANWPGNRSTLFINQLKNLELQAREQHRGLWGEAASHPAVSTGAPPPPAPLSNETKPASGDKIDPNTATREQLLALPGVGPVLADRIIAARPFQSVEDLTRVSGIGPRTLERLRPRLEIAPPSPVP